MPRPTLTDKPARKRERLIDDGKFTWPIAPLTRAVDLVKSCLLPQPFVPVLSHIWATGAVLLAYNDVQAIEVLHVTPFSCAIPGDLLAKILSGVRDEERLTAEHTHNALVLRHGHSKAELATLPPTDFLFSLGDWHETVAEDLAGQQDAVQFSLPLNAPVVEGLQKCLLSIGGNPMFPSQMGVTIVLGPEGTTFYSTNNASLAQFVIPSPKPSKRRSQPLGRAILPSLYCQQLVDLAGKLSLDQEDDAGGTLAVGSKYALARWPGGVRAFSKLLIDERPFDFPTMFAKHVPAGRGPAFVEIPEAWGRALDRAALIQAGELEKSVHVTYKHARATVDAASGPGHRIVEQVEFAEPVGAGEFHVDPILLRRLSEGTTHLAFLPTCVALSGGSLLSLISHNMAAQAPAAATPDEEEEAA